MDGRKVHVVRAGAMEHQTGGVFFCNSFFPQRPCVVSLGFVAANRCSLSRYNTFRIRVVSCTCACVGFILGLFLLGLAV